MCKKYVLSSIQSPSEGLRLDMCFHTELVFCLEPVKRFNVGPVYLNTLSHIIIIYSNILFIIPPWSRCHRNNIVSPLNFLSFGKFKRDTDRIDIQEFCQVHGHVPVCFPFDSPIKVARNSCPTLYAQQTRGIHQMLFQC